MRNAPGEKFTLRDAFKCAGRGIAHAFRTQRNLKIHACFLALAVALGALFGISQACWLAIVICAMVVMALEVMNTALETAVDLVSPEWSELARIAKDCAAGAVYLAAIGSLVVAAIIFVPCIIAYIPMPLSA